MKTLKRSQFFPGIKNSENLWKQEKKGWETIIWHVDQILLKFYSANPVWNTNKDHSFLKRKYVFIRL